MHPYARSVNPRMVAPKVGLEATHIERFVFSRATGTNVQPSKR